jgi:hypothetical protein
MNNKSGIRVLTSGGILVFLWIAAGCYIFFYPNAFDVTWAPWARGELGDYVGGGLGGIAVVFIIYTVWLQIGQINSQNNESFEAGVFRTFQALKPEVEGLSIRIVSKVLKANMVSTVNESFTEMLKKYKSGDKTVFLRAMQNPYYCNAIRSNHNDDDLKKATNRFEKIMKFLEVSIDKTEENSDDDFSQAIKSTEIYETYEKCFK